MVFLHGTLITNKNIVVAEEFSGIDYLLRETNTLLIFS